MYLNTLALSAGKVLEKLGARSWLKDFYLAGGTALALQYGHRRSVDLDWFTAKNIATKTLLRKIQKVGKFQLLNEEENTVEGYLEGVKLSFMTYPYVLVNKKIKFADFVYLASALDIALMKITAISSRNAKKDFIDLYWYLKIEKTDLGRLFVKMDQKFHGIDYDVMHICKALMYFQEADKEPLPKMLQSVSWTQVKNYFRREVKDLIKG